MRGKVATAFPWLFLLLMAGIIVTDQIRPRGALTLDARLASQIATEALSSTDGGPTDRDPVCRMVLRKASAYRLQLPGRDYYFCSTACRNEAAREPARWLAGRALTPETERTMRGIPDWLFRFGAGFVLLVSFGLFEILDRRKPAPEYASLSHRLDLLPAESWRHRLVRSAVARFVVQLFMVALFGLIIVTGLFGRQNPAFNIAPMLTWTLWWAGLIFFVLYFGTLWCYACPWDALATWMERLQLWGSRRRGLGLRLAWPAKFRNIWLAVASFVVLTWIELNQGVTSIPRVTAILALTMLAMTVVGAFVFDRKSFCRYGCLVGRITGLYALFAPIELRTRTRSGCSGCTTRDCFVGNSEGDGCPTFEYPRSMDRNTYCTLCTDCMRTCPTDNMTLNLRPWASDLAKPARPRLDEAVLAIVLLAMTSFHGLTMIPAWPRLLTTFATAFGLERPAAFTLLTIGIVLVPIALFWLIATTSAAIAREGRPITYFLHYAYALLPIALFYHLAHTAEHFLMEGPRILAMASDPFGFGWNLFGTARTVFPPLVTLEGLWFLQVLFVLVGHLYGLWLSQKTTRRLIAGGGRRVAVQLPMLATMIASTYTSLWLLSQPMVMHLSAM